MVLLEKPGLLAGISARLQHNEKCFKKKKEAVTLTTKASTTGCHQSSGW